MSGQHAGTERPAPPAGPTLRLGSVAYLNMQPLVHGLPEAGGAALGMIEGPPSRLAEWLTRGEVDLAMVPVAAWFAHPEWRAVGRSMIGARGAVASVCLLGHGDPAKWRTLRPDSHSRTSNALAQVLLRRRWGNDFTLGEPLPPEPDLAPPRLGPGEACVAIGSRALAWSARWSGTVIDLGAAWVEWTGLPLVCALWCARPGAELGDWPEWLEAYRRSNQPRLPAIAAAWPTLAPEGLDAAGALRYLTRNIDYDFDEAARAGLIRFHEEGVALGLFPGDWQAPPAGDRTSGLRKPEPVGKMPR